MTLEAIQNKAQIQAAKFEAAKQIQEILNKLEATVDNLAGEGSEVVNEVLELISEE